MYPSVFIHASQRERTLTISERPTNVTFIAALSHMLLALSTLLHGVQGSAQHGNMLFKFTM